jgi:hypothetical protein
MHSNQKESFAADFAADAADSNITHAPWLQGVVPELT